MCPLIFHTWGIKRDPDMQKNNNILSNYLFFIIYFVCVCGGGGWGGGKRERELWDVLNPSLNHSSILWWRKIIFQLRIFMLRKCLLTLRMEIKVLTICFKFYGFVISCRRRGSENYSHHFHTKIPHEKIFPLFSRNIIPYYPPAKSEGYRFGVVHPSIPSVRTFCLSRTISQYLLVRFNSFLVHMISTMNSRYPISLVKIDPLTLELLPLFKYRQL